MAKMAKIAAMPLILLTSCNYLDVIPPAQADYDDTMKDEAAVINYLGSCYYNVGTSHPYDHNAYELSADEIIQPREWGDIMQSMQWGTLSASYYFNWGGSTGSSDGGVNIWIPAYNHIGYLHRFENLLTQLSPTGVTEDMKDEYRAEAKFLDAYYHFRVLAAFGPCPIMRDLPSQNISKEDIPGRSHFDYCVDYIVGKLDEAIPLLPETRPNAELPRATSVAAKCLKARVLLYAASPLWNGSFYDKEWANKNYETEGYGKELVSHTYDQEKWKRALTACQEALSAAESAGYKLYSLEDADAQATIDKLGLPFVPGKEEDTEENNLFKRRVRMFQYLSTMHEGAGNTELIWAVRINNENQGGGGEAIDCRLPNRVLKRTNGKWVGGWAGMAPTLNSANRFYTENGKLPELDPKFPKKSDWYTRFYEGTQSPEYGEVDNEDVKHDIIKLNGGREARFYAWITFDGTQYMQKIADGNPLWLNLKNEKTNGYRVADKRNVSGTGYLSKKFIDPNFSINKTNGNKTIRATRRPLIRMAELYLNLAECYAALGQTSEALQNLNVIRERAGIPDLTDADLTPEMSLTDWVRNERAVELFEEGHRYYDIRRWCIAPEVLKAGVRQGLNGLTVNPTFEEFNKPSKIDQPFKWMTRYYLLPVWSRNGNDQLYSNPQLVQAPGY